MNGTSPTLRKQQLNGHSRTCHRFTSRDKDQEGVSAEEQLDAKGPWRRWMVKWELPRKVLHSSIGCFALIGWLQDLHLPTLVIYLSSALVIVFSADVLRFRYKRFAHVYEYLLGFLMRPSERFTWNGVIFYLLGVIIVIVTVPRDIAVWSILTLSWCDTSASMFGRTYGRFTLPLPSPPFARRKSLAGFLAALTTGTLITFVFWTIIVPMNAFSGVSPSWKSSSPSSLSSLSSSSSSSLPPTFIPSSLKNPETPVEALRGYCKGMGACSMILGRGQLPNPKSNMNSVTLSLVGGVVGAVAESVDLWGLDDNLTLPVLSGWGMWMIMWILG